MLPFRILVIVTLLVCSESVYSNSDEKDTTIQYLTSKKGLEKSEAYYNVIFNSLRTDIDRARHFIEEYERVSKGSNNSIVRAYADLNKGLYYSVTGNLDSSVYHLEEVKRVAGKGNSLLLIRSESSLGKVYISKGKPEKGLLNLFNALELLQSSPDADSEVKVRINIMWAYLELKRYKDCIDFGRNALNYVPERLTWMLPYLYNNLAVSYGAIGKIDSAKFFIERSIPIALKYNDNNLLANAHFILGTIYSNAGNYNLAIKEYNKAKPFREKVGNPFFIVADQYTLADLYAKVGDFTTGIKAGLEGLRLAEEHNLTLKFEGVYQALAKNYEGIGDYKNASKYYNLWAVAKDSVYRRETVNAIAEMQTKYETERKEKEINLQRLIISEQNLKISKNRFLLIGLTLLFIFSVLVFFLWRSRQRYKEQKIQEEIQRKHQEELTKAIVHLQEIERSRFAKDLHDGFGQLITALKMQVEKIGLLKDGIPELIQHMHDEIRNVSFALSPQVLSRDGLIHALRELAFRINRGNTVTISVQTTGITQRLDVDYETTLYRVCQEWINNVLKYSTATQVNIQIVEHDDEITLMIEDNGKGFDASILGKSMGNGWRNIESRMQLVGGTFEVDSSPDRIGTTFTVSIPSD